MALATPLFFCGGKFACVRQVENLPPRGRCFGYNGIAMSATYVIDGYNLLHAMGLLGGRAGPHGLEKARGQLVGLLRGGFGGQAGAVTVVFDAANAHAGSNPR